MFTNPIGRRELNRRGLNSCALRNSKVTDCLTNYQFRPRTILFYISEPIIDQDFSIVGNNRRPNLDVPLQLIAARANALSRPREAESGARFETPLWKRGPRSDTTNLSELTATMLRLLSEATKYPDQQ